MKKMAARHLLAAFVLGIGLISQASAKDIDYDCADGTELDVTFDTPASGYGSAILREDGARPRTLPQVMSGSGARYADSTTEFWIKGTNATLTRDGKTTTCTVD